MTAYPQRQTRPAERKITIYIYIYIYIKWRFKSSAQSRVDWWRDTGDSKGRWFSIFTGNQPRRVRRKCVYSTPLPCITYLNLYEKYVLKPRQRCRTITDRILREWGGRNCWQSSLSALKDVSDFDIPSSVALEILEKTGQCLAKFQTDTPIRIYICKAFTFRLHQIPSLTNSDDIVNVYFFLQFIKQYCKQ